MTGLKSGSGDDLWSDDSDEDAADERTVETDEESTTESTTERETERGTVQEIEQRATDETTMKGKTHEASESQPYIVRRAVQDKSIQFERDERLTFFVHDDVVDGERELLTEVESALGRDVPKFDVREAVYRAALRNPDDVLDELLQMGYALDEE